MTTKRPDADANNPDTGAPEPGSYSSPACSVHEFEGSGADASMKSWDDIRAWRKRTREALIASRMALGVGVRQEKGDRAKQRLLEVVDLKKYATLGIYWPMRERSTSGTSLVNMSRRAERWLFRWSSKKARPLSSGTGGRECACAEGYGTFRYPWSGKC